jgi:hypothetical protein
MNRVDDFPLAGELDFIDAPPHGGLSPATRSAPALATISQVLDVAPKGAQLAKRKIEYRQGDQSIVISDEYFDSRTRRPQVVFVADDGRSTDTMTVFCYGFAASAIVVVVTLLAALLLQR